jgi:glucose-6-phosphate-specific signal transduction histidine kinase
MGANVSIIGGGQASPTGPGPYNHFQVHEGMSAMSARKDPIEEVIDALRKALDRALAERDDALRASVEVESQRDLSRDLTLRFENELEAQRRDLARRLADDLGAQANTVRQLAGTLQGRLQEQDPSLRELAAMLARGADALCESLRLTVAAVRPEALAFGGLLEGLRVLLADWRLRAGQVRFELLAQPADDAGFGLGPSRVELAGYAAVATAIEQAVGAGRAGLVVVSASRGDDCITLQVSDDGLPHGKRPPAADGGLEALQARVGAVDGALTLRCGESGGAELLVTLPWPQRPDDRGAGV